jgi:hypothetical protein
MRRWTAATVTTLTVLTLGAGGAPGCASGGRRAPQSPGGATAAGGPAAAAATWAAGPAARAPLADVADTLFWRTLHAGQYDSIPRAKFLLQAAYLQNPRDPRTTAHLGFLHAWASAERARLTPVPPTTTDHVILARAYFARAAALDPTDARVQGFHAAFEMSDAGVQRDSAAFAAGLARGRAAIAAWPEFNWFTVGYTLSGRPHTSPLFQEAVEMQWRTVDACSRAPVDRTNPPPPSRSARRRPSGTRGGGARAGTAGSRRTTSRGSSSTWATCSSKAATGGPA